MNIIFADDHSMIRESLRPFLDELGDNVDVREAENLDGALAATETGPAPDLILLDLNMPGMNGHAGIGKMVAACPQTPIVILSGQITHNDVMKALELGASGYIPKTASGATLLNALRLVLSGEKYLPSSLLSNEQGGEPDGSANGSLPGQGSALDLAERQMTILQQVVEGKTYKEIARELDLAEITIKVEVRKIYRKLGAANRSQAVRIATRSGM